MSQTYTWIQIFTFVLKTKEDIEGAIHICIDYMKEDIYEFHNQRRHLKCLQNDTYIYVRRDTIQSVQFEARY